MKPVPLDSELWKKLPTAYGTAETVPLRYSQCLETSDSAHGCAWALIPHLVERLDELDPDGLEMALGIIATNIRYAPQEPPYAEVGPPYQP